jgi:hypothetical protein
VWHPVGVRLPLLQPLRQAGHRGPGDAGAPGPDRAALRRFLFFKHGDDNALAQALELELSRFAKPLFQRVALRVFRDGSDLSASPDLWDTLEDALKGTDQLVALCSPKWAESLWCQKEVDWWLEHHGVQDMVLFITAGEVHWDEDAGDFDWDRTTALPRSLAGRYTGEPLYVDARELQGQAALTLAQPGFRQRLVTLAATLHRTSVEALDGEASLQHKRTLRIRNGTIAGVVVLLGLLGWTGVLWKQSADLAAERAELARQQQARADGEALLGLARADVEDDASQALAQATAAYRHAKAEGLDTGPYADLLVQAFNRPALLPDTAPFRATPATPDPGLLSLTENRGRGVYTLTETVDGQQTVRVDLRLRDRDYDRWEQARYLDGGRYIGVHEAQEGLSGGEDVTQVYDRQGRHVATTRDEVFAGSHNGATVAFASGGATVRWGPGNTSVIHECPPGVRHTTVSVAVSPDGEWAASVSEDGWLYVAARPDPRGLAIPVVKMGVGGHPGQLSFSADGEQLRLVQVDQERVFHVSPALVGWMSGAGAGLRARRGAHPGDRGRAPGPLTARRATVPA